MADKFLEENIKLPELRADSPAELQTIYENWYVKNKDFVDGQIDKDVQLRKDDPNSTKIKEALRLIWFGEHLTELCFPRMMNEERQMDLMVTLSDRRDIVGASGPSNEHPARWNIKMNKEEFLALDGSFNGDKSGFTFGGEAMARIILFGAHELAHQFNPPSDENEYDRVTADVHKLDKERKELEFFSLVDPEAEKELVVLDKKIEEARIRVDALPDEYMARTWEKRVANRFLGWSKAAMRFKKIYDRVTDYKKTQRGIKKPFLDRS